MSILGSNRTGIVMDINPLFKTARVNVHKPDGTVEPGEFNGSELKGIEEGVLKQRHDDVDLEMLKELED